MRHITVLLLDGPADGQTFALIDDRHTVEVFSHDNQFTYRYQIQSVLLGDQIYMIGVLDPAKVNEHEVAVKIRAAMLEPVAGA
jgi:hypothetical protein